MDRTGDSDGAGRVTSVGSFLEHFGVKGMKWGKRGGGSSPKEPPSKDASAALALRGRAKKSKPKALTNAELQQAINRMNLEQQFKRLATNEKPAVTRFIASTMLEIGKREVQQTIAKKAVKLATKVAA
jgi:hypothetical protein